MNTTINPSKIVGNVKIAPSKSYLQRAIAMACFSDSFSTIIGYEPSNDVDAALNIARSLGKKVVIENNVITISGLLSVKNEITLNMGESGLCTRMFAPMLGLLGNTKITLIGEGSLLKRPMQSVVNLLTQMGCNVSSNNGFLPITIHSGIYLETDNLTFDASDSSQLLTGLLMTLPLVNEIQYKQNGFTVLVANLVSKPYIDITLEVMQHCGIEVEHYNYEKFVFYNYKIPYCQNIEIEGDWSGAAFLLVAGAISGSVILSGLNKHSVQPDRAILMALESCGARVTFDKDLISCSKNLLNAFVFDATHCPDLFPPLAVLASQCNGTSTIIGTNRLIFKESNRALTIQNVLYDLGIDVRISDNCLHIKGGAVIGSTTNSHNDHRIAMMAATLALVATQPILIEQADAVNKSYPKFYRDLRMLSQNNSF